MIYVVIGPTAVGKTKYSLELAKKHNAVILNCDAMQMYEKLNIGTAKISLEEMDGIKHYLFDIKKPDEQITIFEYQKLGRKILNDHDNVVITGGSGLYLRALLYDYEFEEEIKINVDLSVYSNSELYDLLISVDPKSLKIHENNRQRVMRAYLYYLKTNKSIHDKKESKLIYECQFIGLYKDRSKLYEIIDSRVDLMILNGLEEEVKSLYLKYENNFIGKSIIGYKEFIDYFESKITYDECVDLIKQHTRNYAKKQMTFFKNQFKCEWIEV